MEKCRSMDSPSIIPAARSTMTGVSVEYVQAVDKRWFVMRASYGREKRASDFMIDDGTFTFLPMQNVWRNKDGHRQCTREVLVPNILFVYTTEEQAETYTKETPQLAFLTYYYDHFTLVDGKNPPLVVPQHEMMNFVKAVTADSDHLRLIKPGTCKFRNGDKVRVTQGSFQGVEGMVARVGRQQRVVVTIRGLCSVATAYVPDAFLTIIS